MAVIQSVRRAARVERGKSAVLGGMIAGLCAAHFVPTQGLAEPAAAIPPTERRPDAQGDDGRVVVPAILQRAPDGGYVYRGRGFDAKIAANGAVTMRNRYGRLSLFAGTFDLTARAEAAAGNDPYLSERRAFFDATRAFREALSDRADRRVLLRQLTAIRFDPRLSMRDRRARTFAVWDEMADDEKGAEGREILQAFVRAQYTGQAAFGARELALFNARRRSRQVFDPYRAQATTELVRKD